LEIEIWRIALLAIRKRILVDVDEFIQHRLIGGLKEARKRMGFHSIF